jgi:hypothetical protein
MRCCRRVWIACVVLLSAGSFGCADESPPDVHEASKPALQEPLGECRSLSTKPCGTFSTEEGTEITLGRYGAVMEPNVGAGFENTVASGDADPAVCESFVKAFGESAALTAKLADVTTNHLDFALYTVFRPARWPVGMRIPIVTWGNATCTQPEGYGALLRYVASQGFFVIAANSRWVGGPDEMLHALDFAFAANDDRTSPYYQKLDTSQVGAMGHSVGASTTGLVESDDRVRAIIQFNPLGANPASSKPVLAITGDGDFTGISQTALAALVEAAPSAAWLFLHGIRGDGPEKGHLTVVLEPERLTGPTAAWWGMMLSDDAMSRSWFAGPDCMLCDASDQFEYGQHGLD